TATADQDFCTATHCEAAPLVSTLPLDDELFREIVVDFIAYLDDELTAMRQAWATGDRSRLGELAHSLKGAGGAAGFNAFTQPCQQLQHGAATADACQIENILGELTALAGRIAPPPGACL
ncbi:MAG: Hpt domain-containing protein, partial [Planctomycetales bacterium]|nr:Hpt domain-containing protein [Planctomycetales bacterium]